MNATEQSGHPAPVAPSVDDDEIQRAVEMMKRAKSYNEAQAVAASEDLRMPTYFLPQSIFLCSSATGA
jgi:hypothetical protein